MQVFDAGKNHEDGDKFPGIEDVDMFREAWQKIKVSQLNCGPLQASPHTVVPPETVFSQTPDSPCTPLLTGVYCLGDSCFPRCSRQDDPRVLDEVEIMRTTLKPGK